MAADEQALLHWVKQGLHWGPLAINPVSGAAGVVVEAGVGPYS